MQIFKKSASKGFTLLEILLVVGIIAILAGIVIVAINPSKQLATVRNTERKSDIKQINNAITQFYIDNAYYPASTTITTTLKEICDTGTATSSATCGDLVNLTELVPTYLVAIPVDPSGASSTLAFIPKAYAATGGTGYKVGTDSSNKIVMTAPLAELDVFIAIGTTTVAEEEEEVDACGTPGDATDADCWSTEVSDKAWSTEYVNTTADSLTDGAANTLALVAIAGNNYPAAEYCYGLDQGGHQDWYLPAKDELWAGWGALGSGGFASDRYWSSTEDSLSPAWFAWGLYSGTPQMGRPGKEMQNSVRCLR